MHGPNLGHSMNRLFYKPHRQKLSEAGGVPKATQRTGGKEDAVGGLQRTEASLGAPFPSDSLYPKRPASPPPLPGPRRPMGCAERHFPAAEASGERPGGGRRRGRGGRRRRWQPAGTHAAPRPARPAALPPPAAAARCPLTSGGE